MSKHKEMAEQLRALTQRVVSVQEDERHRLSVELHDRTGANLAAINLNVAAIARLMPQCSDEDQTLLAETRALVIDTVASIREFCGELRPATLAYAGLVPALSQCMAQFGQRHRCEARFEHQAYSGQCSAETASLLYRIAQEALLNCGKHAQATAVRLCLSGTPGRLSMTVSDNGRGFDPSSLGRAGQPVGQGLLNMRDRAALAGGSLLLESAPGHGTTVTVNLAAA